ncbi:MAG TPA: DUF1700 domain-containing protein [Symbiobacteriaceae bacterium]|nr:DUF1700 domain-containing protein [Symbiobacteriaceae bacterium]
MREHGAGVEQFLAEFRAGLLHVPPDEQDEMVREIESHIAEAASRGEPVAKVLQKLGPAETLARAYRAEVLISGPNNGGGGHISPRSFLRAAVIVASTSLINLMVVGFLGVLGIASSLWGLAVLGLALASVVNPALAERTSNASFIPMDAGLPAYLVFGAILAVVGALSFTAMRFYLRYVANHLTRMIK